MAKDKVKLEIPSLDKTEREFYVTVVSNGKKLGDMTVMNDGIQWYSYRSKKARKVEWKKFDQLVTAFD